MASRYIAVAVLASLLAACGAQTGKMPQSGHELIDLVTIPPGWETQMQGELDQEDIPGDAYTGLQASYREIAFEPLQQEGSVPTVYLFVLLYEDSTAARNAYVQIKTHKIAEGAEVGNIESGLPNEEVTFALTQNEATADKLANALLQTTILSCRAVVRFNWALYSPSFTTRDAANLELTSAKKIKEATCNEE